MNSKKFQQQIDYLEEVVQRRMANTGENRKEACDHIISYLTNGRNSNEK